MGNLIADLSCLGASRETRQPIQNAQSLLNLLCGLSLSTSSFSTHYARLTAVCVILLQSFPQFVRHQRRKLLLPARSFPDMIPLLNLFRPLFTAFFASPELDEGAVGEAITALLFAVLSLRDCALPTDSKLDSFVVSTSTSVVSACPALQLWLFLLDLRPLQDTKCFVRPVLGLLAAPHQEQVDIGSACLRAIVTRFIHPAESNSVDSLTGSEPSPDVSDRHAQAQQWLLHLVHGCMHEVPDVVATVLALWRDAWTVADPSHVSPLVISACLELLPQLDALPDARFSELVCGFLRQWLFSPSRLSSVDSCLSILPLYIKLVHLALQTDSPAYRPAFLCATEHVSSLFTELWSVHVVDVLPVSHQQRLTACLTARLLELGSVAEAWRASSLDGSSDVFQRLQASVTLENVVLATLRTVHLALRPSASSLLSRAVDQSQPSLFALSWCLNPEVRLLTFQVFVAALPNPGPAGEEFAWKPFRTGAHNSTGPKPISLKQRLAVVARGLLDCSAPVRRCSQELLSRFPPPSPLCAGSRDCEERGRGGTDGDAVLAHVEAVIEWFDCLWGECLCLYWNFFVLSAKSF
jgi:hypothetical protein